MKDNYFQLFDMEANFDINDKKLDELYNKQIEKFHPDKFVAKSSMEKLQALQNTSLINSAYQIIKKPLERAVYILELNGINAFDDKDTNMDIEFLMQQSELREDLENIQNDKNEDRLDKFIKNIDEKITLNIKDLNKLFKNKADLVEIKNCVRELKFYEQLLKEANNSLHYWL